MTITSTTANLSLPELEAYEVLAPIARGGMAEVFLARLRSRPDRLVALKIMRRELCKNQEFVAMFLDEARIASGLAHPNIAAIYGLGHDSGHHYIAMELLRGRTLLDVVDIALRRGVKLPFEVVAWIGARMADALHYAHELRDASGSPMQIIHRDVNPQNIFVTFGGEPKLIDFGLAKARDRITATAHGILKGKLAYVAPEQVTGAPIDRRADVFALGVTLWEVSVGDRLFRDDSDVETIRRVSRAEVPDPTKKVEGYPRALADIVLKALARSPAERYRTAGELARALDAFVNESGRPVQPAQVGAVVRSLFPPDSAKPWEKLAAQLESKKNVREDALAGGELVRAWDDEAQKMTWMAMDASSIIGAATAPTALPTRLNGAGAGGVPWREGLEVALAERLAAIAPSDTIARSRALLELALVDEWLGDGATADAHAQSSTQLAPSAAAFAALRRLRHAAGDPAALVKLLDEEVALVSDNAARADLFAERGRLLQVAGDLDAARASFGRALDLASDLPAALKGIDVVLREKKGASRELAAHLGVMADAYDKEPALAAWLHVERARILDDALGMPADAKGALEQALELDPGLGPVRAACVAHAVVHRDAAWLVALLLDEAAREPHPDRAAALELEAAIVCRARLADARRAVTVLERTRSRAMTRPSLRRAVLDELAALHERASRWEAALGVRRERLSTLETAGERTVELRAIVGLEEKAGNIDAAIAALDDARRLEPNDETLVNELDRALERANDVVRRVSLWADEAAKSGDAERRAACLERAAALAEEAGDVARAVELHRATLAASPARVVAVDALDRLLRGVPNDEARERAGALVALHRHGAEHAPDRERRIAHLETAALLEEEALGDPALAASTHEAILAIAPERRSALVGLARTARRAGDPVRAARALLTESELVEDAAERDRLRIRAAEWMAHGDADRAAALLGEVLSAQPAHRAARAAKKRVHERAEQWTLVDREIAAEAAQAKTGREKVDVLLARAELQRSRLGEREHALATVHAALEIDPSDARALALAAAILDEMDDDEKVERGLVELAKASADASVRARMLLRAANIAEHGMADDGRALALLRGAMESSPDVAWLEERARRLAMRRARAGSTDEYEAALDKASAAGDRNARVELLLLRLDRAPEGAIELAERVFADEPRAPHALRLLERTAAATGRVPLLANALSGQVEAFAAPVPRLGAVWEAVRLVEWKLGGDVRAELDLARQLAPHDRAALDGVLRRGLASLHAGHDGAREGLANAARVLAEQPGDETTRLASRLALAFALLPRTEHDKPTNETRAALAEFREALRIDVRSVVAATGAARLGPVLSDAEAAVAGLVALADIAPSKPRRAQLLTQGAGTLAAAGDAALGPRAQRLARAAELLERALDADPDAILSATMLAGVRTESGERDRLLAVLGATLERATERHAIAAIGMELARVARERPETRVRAIDALRRVVAAVPTDAGAWRALAAVCLQEGARAEAAAALEAVAANAREPNDKLEALFGLVDLYRESGAAADVDRVLRVIIDVDPASVRALRELAALRRGTGAPRAEVVALLARLADAARPGEEKSATLGELADAQAAAGDRAAAEASLIEAAAQAPTAARLARVLELHAGAPNEQARALSAVVARGEQLGRPDAAAWAALGQIEVDALQRTREGVAHLKRALALEPAMPEARAAMARGLAATGQRDDAVNTVLGMIVPDAAPLLSLRDPGGALSVLEGALKQQGRRDESIVVRELRALGGALDDGSHVELRARRRGPVDAAPGALDAQRLASALVPEEGRGVALALAGALAGVEGKLVRSDLESLDVSPRQRVLPASGHPLAVTLQWIARLFAIETPPLLLSSRLTAPRAISVDGEPWVAAPANMTSRPEPEQVAMLVRPAVRIALALPWLDDAPNEVHAVLCGVARRVVGGYASELRDADSDAADEWSQRIARVIGRRQKKALAELAPTLSSAPTLTPAAAQAFVRAVLQAELRTAFVITGDLLATVDALRASDPAFARDTDAVGPRTLAAVLTHPIASDLARFALGGAATAMRTRLGTA